MVESMRNSAVRHKRGRLLAPILLLAGPLGAATEPFQVTREDVVVIQAETAWEDVIPDTVNFSGGFEMRVRDWRLTADRATVRGPLQDPESVELEGSPARLHLVRGGASGPEAVEAEAERIIYQREPQRIRLDGAARLAQGGSVLRSSHVEYDPRTDRVQAAGVTGVQIDVRGAE